MNLPIEVILPKAIGWLRAMTRNRFTDQEYTSIASDAILRAAQRYNPKKSQIMTYLSYFLRGSLYKYYQQIQPARLPVQTGEHPDPGQQLLRDEQCQLVEHALAHLDDLHREIVILRTYFDCSYAQISEHVGLSISSVWRLYQESLAQLKHILLTEYDSCL